MTIKTLLLGSAAAVAVVGGAQAADLSVAEPVEYVKVCDYFGTGYWYIPGTDTCIKIGGHVQLTADFGADGEVGYNYHSSTWQFKTEEEVNFDLKSETEYGPFEAYASIKADQNGGYAFWNGYYGTAFQTDGLFVALGGFKAGAYQITGGSYVGPYSFMDTYGLAYDIVPFHYADMPTVQLSWASGGVNATVAVTDPKDYFGYYAADSAPLVTGQIGMSQKNFSFGVSGGFLSTQYLSGGDSTWGIAAIANFNIGAADKLMVEGAYGGNLLTGLDTTFSYEAYNNGYVLQGSWQHTLSKTLRLDADLSYGASSHSSGYTAATVWGAGADLVWSPVAGFSAKAAVGYAQESGYTGAWSAELGVRRDW